MGVVSGFLGDFEFTVEGHEDASEGVECGEEGGEGGGPEEDLIPGCRVYSSESDVGIFAEGSDCLSVQVGGVIVVGFGVMLFAVSGFFRMSIGSVSIIGMFGVM